MERQADEVTISTGGNPSLLSGLKMQPGDALLALIEMYRRDERDQKIDVGVGVYKNEAGETPVLAAVKEAEEHLLKHQTSKGYLGPEGDPVYFEALGRLVFADAALMPRLAGLQTPGGTGALRLGAEFIARANRDATIFLGEPTWPNHAPIFKAASLSLGSYRHMEIADQSLCFDEMLDALGRASPGDVVLLHGCCHNPTGVDFSRSQWRTLAQFMADRRLLPFIDFAYHGLGDGLERDAVGLRLVAQHCPEMLVAYSCDKNFGLYRERVGALFVLSRTREDAAVMQSNLLSLARANWSMPPDHGAAIVRIILSSDELTAQWQAELDAMRGRIVAMRQGLAALDPALGFIADQKGMFSTLALTPEKVRALREDHGVYMAGSGRINIAGLVPGNLENFAAALAAVRQGE